MDEIEMQNMWSTSFNRKRARLWQCLLVLTFGMAIVLIAMQASSIQVVFVFGLVAGFMTAWGNAANDICNSVGTAVGGGAMTLAQAVTFGALFEVIGCVTLGPFVSKSIVKGIISPVDYVDTPQIYAFGMACVLFGAGTTTLLATFYGYPISATHGIIGGLIAVGMAAKGTDSVGWSKVGLTACGWVGAPLAGALVSTLVFGTIHCLIYRSKSPARRSSRVQPLFLWLCFAVNIAFVLIKGPKALRVKPIWLAVIIAAAAAVALCPVFYAVMFVGKRFCSKREESRKGVACCPAGDKFAQHLGLGDETPNDVKSKAFQFQRTTAAEDAQIVDEEEDVEKQPTSEEKERGESEKYFVPLLIVSALSVACAHGGNDVGNAVGPLSAIIMVANTNTVSAVPDIPLWALFYGTVGFVLGIVTMGRHTIKTVGTKLTTLTPSKSFATQMGGAVAVLGSSALGLPVSTSHCLVGSVVGIGAFETIAKTGHLNLGVLTRIFLAWGITIPLSMFMSTLVFVPFKGFFE